MEMVEERIRLLDKSDRCDGCAAQAYVLALKDSQELQFCLHHSGRYAETLQAQGWTLHVQDVDF